MPVERYTNGDYDCFIEQYRYFDDNKIENQKHDTFEHVQLMADNFEFMCITYTIFKVKLKKQTHGTN